MTTVTRQMVSFSSSVGGSLCGKNEMPLQFWDPDLKDVSQCFVRLCLICPAYFLLALVSIRAFHKCLHVPPDVIVTRTVVQKVALWTRLFSVVLLSVSPALCLTLMFVLDPDPSWSDCGYSIFIETSFKSLGFLCQLGYVVMLIKGREKSPRGRKSVLIFWAVCAVLSGIQARSQLKIYFPPGPMLEKDVMFASIIMFLGGLALYLMTLIPGPHQEEPTGDQERLMDASPGKLPLR